MAADTGIMATYDEWIKGVKNRFSLFRDGSFLFPPERRYWGSSHVYTVCFRDADTKEKRLNLINRFYDKNISSDVLFAEVAPFWKLVVYGGPSHFRRVFLGPAGWGWLTDLIDPAIVTDPMRVFTHRLVELYAQFTSVDFLDIVKPLTKEIEARLTDTREQSDVYRRLTFVVGKMNYQFGPEMDSWQRISHVASQQLTDEQPRVLDVDGPRPYTPLVSHMNPSSRVVLSTFSPIMSTARKALLHQWWTDFQLERSKEQEQKGTNGRSYVQIWLMACSGDFKQHADEYYGDKDKDEFYEVLVGFWNSILDDKRGFLSVEHSSEWMQLGLGTDVNSRTARLLNTISFFESKQLKDDDEKAMISLLSTDSLKAIKGKDKATTVNQIAWEIVAKRLNAWLDEHLPGRKADDVKEENFPDSHSVHVKDETDEELSKDLASTSFDEQKEKEPMSQSDLVYQQFLQSQKPGIGEKVVLGAVDGAVKTLSSLYNKGKNALTAKPPPKQSSAAVLLLFLAAASVA